MKVPQLPTSQPPTHIRPFDELDADWAAECWRHRRSTLVVRWAREEPALATARLLEEVIPSTWSERGPRVEALVRLASRGDHLALKALLQLLRPGLVGLARELAFAYGGTSAAGREVLAQAAIYLRRLGSTDIRCSPAWYVIQSVKRDLVDDHRRNCARAGRLTPAASIGGIPGRAELAPSAEEVALSGRLIQASLADAVQRGDVSNEAAQIVWLRADGHSLTEAAKAVGVSPSQAHRLHARALAVLRRELDEAR